MLALVKDPMPNEEEEEEEKKKKEEKPSVGQTDPVYKRIKKNNCIF